MNDSDEKIVKPCLILPEIPVNFDPNSVPTSGEEYLMHMAYERKQLPAVSFIPGHKSGESMGSDSQDPKVSGSFMWAFLLCKLTTLLSETKKLAATQSKYTMETLSNRRL